MNVLLVVFFSRFEGWRGYYKGLSVNLVRVVPATIITLVVYENVAHSLLDMKKPNVIEETSTSTIKKNEKLVE